MRSPVLLWVLLFVTCVECCKRVVPPTAFPQCPSAPATPKDRRNNKSVLKVASFNAEWLFLASEGNKNCPGSGCPWRNESEALTHLDNIAKILASVDADIVNIVEVQNCNVLKTLIERLPSQNYLPYLLQGTDSATGQNVGLLTRVDPVQDLQRIEWPLPTSKCPYTGKPGSSGVSKHYFTKFSVKGLSKPLALIGAHLLAFPDRPERCVEREAQATVLQNIAKTFGDSHVIITGDLNDFDREVKDASGNIPMSNVLDILKGQTLFNSAVDISEISDRYSCWYDQNSNCQLDPHELSMIDHLLVSDGLKYLVMDAEFYHGYKPSCSSLNSDHWPVVVSIKTDAEEM